METWARSSWFTKRLRVVLAVSCTSGKRLPLSFLICQSLCLAHTVCLVCLEVLPSSSYLLHCLAVLLISFDVVLCCSIYNILCSSIIYYIMSWLFILDWTLQGQSSVLFICMASVQGRVSVNVRLDGTIPALVDTNHKNRTEQSLERLWKCKLTVTQQGVLKPHWFE